MPEPLQFGHGTIAVERIVDNRPLNPWSRASIRPRHHRRGKVGSDFGYGDEHGRFNSATAPSPWKDSASWTNPRSEEMLQFGHGTIAVESALDNGRLQILVVASIRPRHHRRGKQRNPLYATRQHEGFNSATAPSPWKVQCGRFVDTGPNEASIRPRHHRRGKLDANRPVLATGYRASIRP